MDEKNEQGDYGVHWGSPDRFGRRTFTVEGFNLPYIYTYERGDTNGGCTLRLDERMEFDIPESRYHEIYMWVKIMAQAMAISAGYPCIGVNEKRSPFATGVIGLGPMDFMAMQSEGDD